MIENFIKRPVLSLIISLFITLMGLLSLFTLPVTQFPDIVPPSVMVQASYTGANAEVSTNAVAIPLERAINGVPGMTYMTTVSTNNGTTMIQVFFKVGTDPDIAAVNVQNRVTTVLDELPEEVIKAGVITEKEVNSMLMYLNIYSDDDSADERFIYNFTDINILKELKRIEGVGRAEIMGFKDYAMRVWLKPDRMTAYRLSADDITQAIRQQNVEAAPGQTGIGSDKQLNMQQYVLRYPGKFDTEEQYENIPLRANADGSILRLRDVADVEFGSLEYEMASKADGRPSASIMIKQLPGSNASDVINAIKVKMDELKGTSFPPGMTYSMGYDVSRFLDASISEVIRTLIEAFLLVFLVVFIFLQNFRATIIPALAVPVCLIGALFCMQVMGFSINLLTLFALVLAIGIVVDNAIVVVEAVYAKMEEEHMQPMQATLAAMKEISGAIVAITLVMSAVFVPVAFLSGPVGVFYRQFSLTLAGSIIISGINALTLTPALCALILRSPHDAPPPKGWLATFFKGFNRVYNRISGKYAGLISRIAGRRAVTLVLLIGSFIATWGAAAILPSGFIPTEDQGMVYVNVTAPREATVQRTEAVLDEIDTISRSLGSVESMSTLAGYSLVNEVTGASYGMGMINLKPWEERTESVDDMIGILKDKTAHIADAEIEFFSPPTVPGFGNSSGFELRVLDQSGSDDLDELASVLDGFISALHAAPEIGSAFSSFDPEFPQYMIHVDYDMAAKKGVSVENAMNTLQTLLGSLYTTNFIRFGQMYKVMVQADPQYREKPEDVLRLAVKNTDGEMVPLSSILNMERVYGPELLTRYNMFNAAMINGDAAPGYSSGDAIDAVNRIAAEHLPRGYEMEWSGMTREQILSGNQALYIFALCLLFVYMLLAAQYESFLLPLPVILSLPAGVFGAFLFLKLTGLENNIYAQVALVMLIGLLGKNAILIVEYAIMKNKQAGTDLVSAAVEGAVARLRPILMTSFAFIAGLIPLAMASGAGALGNRSIGTTAIGGMVVGTLAGVIIIPGLYVLFSRRPKVVSPPVRRVISTLLFAASAALFLMGCRTPKEAALPAQKRLPQQFSTQPADSVSVADKTWREYFNDPHLTALVDTLLHNNPDMLQAIQRVEIARANLRMRRKAGLPSVEVAAEAGLRKYGFYTMDGIGNYDTNFSDNLKDDEKLPDPLPDYFLGMRTSWEIDLWGKLKNRKKAAHAQFLASYEGQKLVKTSLVSELASAYYELLALDNQLAIIRKNTALQEKATAITEIQKMGGRATELGVQQFKAVLLNTQAYEQEVKQQIALLENQISFLTGHFSATVTRHQASLTDYRLPGAEATGLPVHMLALRPDIRQAELELVAAVAETKAAKTDFLPSLVLAPYAGLQSFDLSKFFLTPASAAYGLLGGISAPVFRQRTIRSEYEQQVALRMIAFREYEKTILNAWREVRNNLKTLSFLEKRIGFKEREVDALNTAVMASNELFRAGRANYLEVIIAQKSVLEAEISLLQLHGERLQSSVDLYRALGGGWD